MTDAIGQKTTLVYGLQSDQYKITSVIDPFGRTATFGYTARQSDIQLTSITDAVGIVSQFTYGPNDTMTTLTTPYGNTLFATGETDPGQNWDARWVEVTDPASGQERVEACACDNAAIQGTLPNGSLPAGMTTYNSVYDSRNSYYWNQIAMMNGKAGDYTQCHIYHWLDGRISPTDAYGAGGPIVGILEAEKAPLENWIFYNYPGQTTTQGYGYIAGTMALPSLVGRVLDDGTTQLYQMSSDPATAHPSDTG